MHGLAINPDESEVIVIGTAWCQESKGGWNQCSDSWRHFDCCFWNSQEPCEVTLQWKLFCPSADTYVDNVCKLLTSTLELCVISSGASTTKLHGQWLARWSVHGSTILTRYSTEHPLETSVRFRGRSCNTLARVVSGAWSHHASSGWSILASNRVWIRFIYRHIQDRHHEEPEYLADLYIYIVSFQTASRIQDHSGQAQRTVFVLKLPETSFASRAFRHAAPSVWNGSLPLFRIPLRQIPLRRIPLRRISLRRIPFCRIPLRRFFAAAEPSMHYSVLRNNVYLEIRICIFTLWKQKRKF